MHLHPPTSTGGGYNPEVFSRIMAHYSEFFFNIQDNPVLDTGYEAERLDGQGYATFGRVLRGLRVLERMQRLPSDAPTAIEILQGQILEEPVVIRRAYRVEGPGD